MTDGEVAADLGYRPRPWQEKCRAAMKRFNVLVVHRRGGKTVMACITLVDACLRTKKKNARYAYLAPYRVQAKAIAWDYVKAYARRIPGAKILEGELRIDFPNGARLSLYGADDPERLRGLYFDGIVIDELKDIKPSVWGEIVRPALADRIGWALVIGTPKGINLLSQMYFDALNAPDEWYASIWKWDDTDSLPYEEVQAAKRAMSDRQFRQEFECDFNAASEANLITLDMVEEACKRGPREGDIAHAPRILGVDVARMGDDRSVIFPRQGLVAFRPRVHEDIDNVDLAGDVMASITRWGAHATFIDAGRGEGVIDVMRHAGYNPIPVNFGGTKGIPPGYANMRSAMWGKLAQWIRDGGALPNLPELKADLCTPKMDWDNASNLMTLESKKSIRKRGLPSPDLGDALALTFAHPVPPPNLNLGKYIPGHDDGGEQMQRKTRLDW